MLAGWPMEEGGRDIIVIGASAGGIDPLREIVAAFPPDLRAAVFVVVHISPDCTSVLPEILTRAGPLRAAHCSDRVPVSYGRICMAPPDHHLILDDGHVILSRGPRENNSRPSIDVLFRSAALWYGARVVGVVLSGNLDDGAAGLVAIKDRGGLAIVQDPKEAQFPGMPLAAISNSSPDHVLPAREIGALLARLAARPIAAPTSLEPPSQDMVRETRIAKADMPDDTPAEDRTPPGTPAQFACPECGGTLWEIEDGTMTRFRCRVGHAYSPETLLAEQARAVEEALWMALRALEESETLSRGIARRFEAKSPRAADHFLRRAHEATHHAAAIRRVLERGEHASGQKKSDESVEIEVETALQRPRHSGNGEQ
jgi:two-component system chemotaxis response regulator CheB